MIKVNFYKDKRQGNVNYGKVYARAKNNDPIDIAGLFRGEKVKKRRSEAAKKKKSRIFVAFSQYSSNMSIRKKDIGHYFREALAAALPL